MSKCNTMLYLKETYTSSTSIVNRLKDRFQRNRLENI